MSSLAVHILTVNLKKKMSTFPPFSHFLFRFAVYFYFYYQYQMWNLLKGSKWNELSWHGDRCLCWGAGWLVLAVHQASRLLWPVKAHLTAKTLRIMIQEKAPGIKLQNGGKRTVFLAKHFYTAWASLCIQHPTSSLLFTLVFLPAHFSLFFSQYAECARTRREWQLLCR